MPTARARGSEGDGAPDRPRRPAPRPAKAAVDKPGHLASAGARALPREDQTAEVLAKARTRPLSEEEVCLLAAAIVVHPLEGGVPAVAQAKQEMDLPSGRPATRSRPPRQDGFTNVEVVTIAVYLLGGGSSRVDTEDVAIRASVISPGRFSWRKYPDQVNIDTVRKRLWDATKPEHGGYLVGSERSGWQLTHAGLGLARERAAVLEDSGDPRRRLSQQERRWESAERLRMLADPVLARFRDGSASSVSPPEAERFFRVDDYVVGKARQRRIHRILNSFSDDPELGEAVRALAERIRAQ
jgi:hypothetical protein